MRTRTRGVLAASSNATNPNAVLAELQDGFEKFINRNDRRLADVEAELSRVNSQVAGFRVGGGGDAGAGAQAALRNLGEFARTGSAPALIEGLRPSAAMRSGSDPDGGILAPEELSGEIIRTQRDVSPLRRLARVIETSSGAFQQPMSDGGIGSGWVGENEGRPETASPPLNMIDIVSGEIYANVPVTQTLIDDERYDLGTFIVEEMTAEFGEQEGAAFVNGNGLKKPRGFLTYDTTTEADADRDFGKIQYHFTGNASAFPSSDPGDVLHDFVMKLKAGYRRNAAWLMNSTTAATVSKFKDGEGNYLWSRGLAAGQPPALLGYPIEVDENMPNIGANAFPIAFGDWMRGYLIADRTAVRLLRDPYSNKPNVNFYCTKRVGGALVDSNAIKLLKVATS